MINSVNSFMLDKKSPTVLMNTQVSTPVARPKQLPVEKENEINYGKIFIGVGLAAIAVIGGVFALLHVKKRSNDLIKAKDDFIKMQNDLIKLQESDILRHKAHQAEISKLLNEIDVLKQQIEILLRYEAKEVDLQKARGLNRIAGYDEDKKFIRDSFIEPFRRSFEKEHSQEVNVPAGIVLYGPSANGKTTFANGIIEELRPLTKTEYYDLSTETPDSIISKLEKIKEQAATKFKESHTRTLIFIDEIGRFDSDPEKMNQILQKCKETGISLIATKIKPLSDNVAEESGLIQRSIGTPSQQDCAKLLEYYLGDLTQEKINWDSVTQVLEENASSHNYKYSCSELEALTKLIIQKAKREVRLITQQDIVDTIKNKC